MGREWALGEGRVDWMSYRPGKNSEDPAKLSRPSRAYLHVTDQSHLVPLSDHVRQSTFRDAKGSWTSSSLLGPPSVEFAPYGRVPNNKRRADARQGTVDQDPEFMAFLEELTSPIASKKPPEDAVKDVGAKKEDIKTTPLVQFLKDKKANKGKKPATAADARPETKAAVIIKPNKVIGVSSSGLRPSSRGRGAPERQTKENIRVLRKGSPEPSPRRQAASVAKGSGMSDSKNRNTPGLGPARASTFEKKRERGNVAAAARMLRRDLGLVGEPKGRGRSEDAAPQAQRHGTTSPPHGRATDESPRDRAASRRGDGQDSTDSARAHPSEVAAPSSSAADINKARAPPPAGPATARPPKKTVQAGKQSQASSSSSTAATDGARPTQAFVKHANPSQGITEPTLQSAMEAFGTVTKAEIDKKKGFAYVDFSDPDGLQKAIQASPLTIAEGQVVVLERKDRSSGGGGGAGSVRGGRVERGRGRGGSGFGPSPRGGGGGSGGSGGRGGRGGSGGRGASSARRGGSRGGDSPSTAVSVPVQSSHGN